MGNHTAGTAMAKAAEIALRLRRPEDKALELLDLICEHWRGCDAEFDDYAFLDGIESPALALLILEAFAPDEKDIHTASEILIAACRQDWAPISHAGQLHDRASYRFFWQVLERAARTGADLPSSLTAWLRPGVSNLAETPT